ncbi:MAG: dethiobiotin synthase [Campylobacteraceae bacterium 4484_166]|nr:MAG: dethiobiotin synthase [Campylobacteraceae bacterium 4484_166]
MNKVIFVTATNTNIGKTYACENFIKTLSKQNLKLGYIKPIETGVKKKPQDGQKILDIVKKLNKNFKFDIDDVVPYQFALASAVPVANKENLYIDISLILKKTKQMLSCCDIVIVEGAGGLMSPVTYDYFMCDLILDFQNFFDDFEARLITPSYLGCINDTLLSLDILQQKKIKHKWYINLYKSKDEFEVVTKPFYKRYFKEPLNYI